nr:extracellular solute-binding protein [Mesobacillus subterraneus]
MFLAGCDDSSIIDKEEPVKKNVQTQVQELIVWHTYSEEETKVFENDLIPIFEDQNPGIDVRTVRQSHNDQLKSALIARASSGKDPDVVRMDIAWIPKFIELGLVLPLNDYEGFHEVKAQMRYEALKAVNAGGKYYGMPLNTNTKAAIYNKHLLQLAGLSKPPETMEELLDIIEKNDYKIGMSGVTPWQSLPYFYGFGGEFFSPDFKKTSGYFNSKESIKAAMKMKDLYMAKKMTPELLVGSPQIWEGVLSGEYFVIDEGPWFYSIKSTQERARLDKLLVTAPFPVTNGKGSVIGGENLVIMKGAKNPDIAWKFVKWMSDKQAQQLMSTTGLIPANKDVDFEKVYQEFPYYRAYLEGINDSFLRPPIGEWDQVEKIYTKYFELFLSGNMDAQAALDLASKEIDQILKK